MHRVLRDASFQFRLVIWCSLTCVHQTAVTGACQLYWLQLHSAISLPWQLWECLPCWKTGGTDIPLFQNAETISALALLLRKPQPSVLASWEWVTAAGTQRCHTLLCSVLQWLLLPALFHISWPQRAIHAAQEEALPAAGWAEAMPGPWRGRTEMKEAPPHIFLQQRPTNTYCNLRLSAPNIINVKSQPDEHLKGEHGLLSSLTHSKKDFIFRDHC